jgi:hypothetical protein
MKHTHIAVIHGLKTEGAEDVWIAARFDGNTMEELQDPECSIKTMANSDFSEWTKHQSLILLAQMIQASIEGKEFGED